MMAMRTAPQPHTESLVLEIEAMPFLVCMLDGPRNPAGIPDTYPFRLALDTATGHLRQPADAGLAAMLETAYRSGSLLGTAMDDTEAGRAYAADFLRFIRAQAPGARSCLEIGAGRGFLTRKLIDSGLQVDALEPGQANAPHWQRHGVKVIADAFPSAKLKGRYGLIVAYAVLEHIPDLAPFLDACRAQLAPEGQLILAVPDCGPCLDAGDPSILLHEHYHYFTGASLARCLEQAGFRPSRIERAGYGGVLYCAASAQQSTTPAQPDAEEVAQLRSFGSRVLRQRASIAARLSTARVAGQAIGIYCPNRAISLLPAGADGLRFFDDDADLHRKHYPTFSAAIENRADLAAKPVDELWILSRSFGSRIRDRLRQEPSLKQLEIKLAEHILDGAGQPAAGA